MKEYADIFSILIIAPLVIFSGILVVQAFRKKSSKIGPALKDGINRFS